MYLIINADDLGLHPAVRRAVEAGAEAGVITSASLLANGPDAQPSARLNGVGLGAHLNILRGRPLSPPQEIPSLVNPQGRFLGSYWSLLTRRLNGSLDLAQVELEWGRQIERILELGVEPTHLDSEKHIHAWPGLMETACRLARRHAVAWVRRPLEPVAWRRWDIGGLRARLLAHWCRRFPKGPSPAMPQAVWGLADQGRRLTAGRFSAALARPPLGLARVLEIACHPGDPRPGDPDIPPGWGPLRAPGQWETEFKLLTAVGWRNLLRSPDVQLVHYGELEPEVLNE